MQFRVSKSNQNFWIMVFSFYILFSFTQSSLLSAQEIGKWNIGLNAEYSQPVGGLSEWFKPAPTYSIAVGNQYNSNWIIEGIFEYTNFEEENAGSYIKNNVELSLQHYGIVINGKYRLIEMNPVKLFFNVGAGIYNWEGVRGEIQADSTSTPYVPHIDEKKLAETNWSFRSGIGIEIKPVTAFSVEFLAYYRFIVGDLWPTLQPRIELEEVSGFQTLNLSMGIRYFF